MIACLSDPLNCTAWSSCHCQNEIRRKCMLKHIQATMIKLGRDTISCVNRPPGQRSPRYIHAFIMGLEREALASRQQLQALICLLKSFMRWRPGALGESIGLNKSLHNETHGDPFRTHLFKKNTNKNRPYHKPVSWTIRSARRPVGRQQHIRKL